MEQHSFGLKITLLIVLFIAILVFSLFLGRFPINPFTAIKIILSRVFPLCKTWTDAQYSIVINVRLPRILCAALTGAALSVAGCCLQSIFRNPMASPDILGASAGSGFGASLAIICGFPYGATTICSFISGLIAVMLTTCIGKASKLKTSSALILAGIIVGSLFQSGTSFLKLIADTENQLPAITYWLMGSIASAKYKDVVFLFTTFIIGFIPVFLLRWRINILTVSDTEAKSMGINTKSIRFAIILCSTLLSASSVSVCGMIGWIGLIVPHLCRLIFDNDLRHLIPACAIFGAGFMIIADDIARIAASVEIPLGILTSLIGAPVFIYLIISGGTKNANQN